MIGLRQLCRDRSDSTIHKIWGTIIDPGGDPDAIHRVADACRKLSGDLSTVLNALDPVATGLGPEWQAPSGEAFQQTWAKFKPAMTDYANHLNDAGDALDKVADAIHEADIQARTSRSWWASRWPPVSR